MRLENQVAAALGTLHGRAFDVSVTTKRDLFFATSVLRRGRHVYQTNADAVTDFIEHVSRVSAELYPRYRRALDEVLEEERRRTSTGSEEYDEAARARAGAASSY